MSEAPISQMSFPVEAEPRRLPSRRLSSGPPRMDPSPPLPKHRRNTAVSLPRSPLHRSFSAHPSEASTTDLPSSPAREKREAQPGSTAPKRHATLLLLSVILCLVLTRCAISPLLNRRLQEPVHVKLPPAQLTSSRFFVRAADAPPPNAQWTDEGQVQSRLLESDDSVAVHPLPRSGPSSAEKDLAQQALPALREPAARTNRRRHHAHLAQKIYRTPVSVVPRGGAAAQAIDLWVATANITAIKAEAALQENTKQAVSGAQESLPAGQPARASPVDPAEEIPSKSPSDPSDEPSPPPLLQPYEIPSVSSLQSGIRFLLSSNDLDYTNRRPAYLLLTESRFTPSTAEAACASLRERLASGAEAAADLGAQLRSLRLEGFYVGGKTFRVRGGIVRLAASGEVTFEKKQEPNPSTIPLPALCSQSAPYSKVGQVDNGTAWQIEGQYEDLKLRG